MATIAKLDVLLGLKDEFSGALDKSQNKLNSWGQSMTKVGKMMTLGVTLPILGAGAVMVKWAAETEETINKTNVLFGSSADEMLEWSSNASRTMGMSQNAALTFGSSFAGMLNTVAQGPEELANMSTELTQLTADFASFHNLNPEEAFTVIGSALAGEAEAIRRFGVDMSAANVEAVALQMGLAGTAAELTAQDKLLARYAILLNETTEEQGDFARTANSTSNLMKTFRARIRDTGDALGRNFLPYVNRALDFLLTMMDRFDALDPKWQKLILGAGAFAAVMGPLLIIIGMMLPALGAIGVVLAAILSPIGLLVIAIAALIGLGIYAWANDLWGVRDAVDAVIEVLALFRPSLELVIDAFEQLMAGNYDSAFMLLMYAAQRFGDALEQLWPRVVAALSAIGQAIVDWATGVNWGNVLRIAGGLLIDGLLIGAKLGWELIKLWFVTIPTLVIGAIGDAVSIFFTLLDAHGYNLLAGLGNGAIRLWNETLQPWLVGLPGLVVTAVGDLTRTLWQKGTDLLQGLSDAGKEFRDGTLKNWVSLLGTWAYNTIGDVARTLRQKGLDLMSGLYDGILDKWASVKSWLGGLPGHVLAATPNLTLVLFSKGYDIISGLASGIRAATGLVSAALDYVIGLLPGWAQGYLQSGSPARIMIPAGEDVSAGVAEGIKRGASKFTMPALGDVAGQLGSASFGSSSGGGGGQTINIITLEPGRWAEFLAKAENGNAFATQFGSEMALRNGAV